MHDPMTQAENDGNSSAFQAEDAGSAPAACSNTHSCEWQDISEDTPNNVDILICYDDNSVGFYEADDNDFAWSAYDGKERPLTKPKYYMLPKPPTQD